MTHLHVPGQLDRLIDAGNTELRYNLRGQDEEIPAHRLKSTVISIGVRGIKISKKLPSDLKHLSIRKFKKDLKYILPTGEGLLFN